MATSCLHILFLVFLLGFERSCSSVVDRCPDDTDRLIEHPTDCNKFCHCTDTGIYEKRCPEVLDFNPQSRMCDWPDEVQCRRKISL